MEQIQFQEQNTSFVCFPCSFTFLFKQIFPYVIYGGLKLNAEPRLTLNTQQFFCLSLWSTEIT